jgi:hypothetical protein
MQVRCDKARPVIRGHQLIISAAEKKKGNAMLLPFNMEGAFVYVRT